MSQPYAHRAEIDRLEQRPGSTSGSAARVVQRGEVGAGERDLLQLGDQAAPEWATILDMIASEFPESMGETWWGWRVYLKVLAALPLDEREWTFAQEHTGRTAMPTTPVRRAFVGAGRRGGKSLIDALLIVYLGGPPISRSSCSSSMLYISTKDDQALGQGRYT